jgi:hypothetical protein
VRQALNVLIVIYDSRAPDYYLGVLIIPPSPIVMDEVVLPTRKKFSDDSFFFKDNLGINRVFSVCNISISLLSIMDFSTLSKNFIKLKREKY